MSNKTNTNTKISQVLITKFDGKGGDNAFFTIMSPKKGATKTTKVVLAQASNKFQFLSKLVSSIGTSQPLMVELKASSKKDGLPFINPHTPKLGTDEILAQFKKA